MATKIAVALEDDLNGGRADETVRFGLGGSDYEIDLSKKNAAALRKQVMPFVEHARKVGRGQRRRTARTYRLVNVAPKSVPGRRRTTLPSATGGVSRRA